MKTIWCDGCGNKKPGRRIELGGGSGISLCDPCLRREIAWRKERNKSVWSKFRIKYKFR